MISIRQHDGEIRICDKCGQPCYEEQTDYGLLWTHFSEQWDGVLCPNFPLANNAIAISWDHMALATLKKRYPDSR